MNETSKNLIAQVAQQQQHTTQIHTVNPPTDSLATLVSTQGNIDLAAHRLGISPSDLLAQISNDPAAKDLLPLYIRTAASLYLFESLSQMRLALQTSIPDLQPYEVVKAFTALVQLLNTLTQSSDTASTLPIQDLVYRLMPPEARDALMALQAAT